MPNIKLSDRFGLSIDATPNDSSSFVKYFKSLSKLRFSELNADQLKNIQLDNLPVKAFSAGILFEEPVDIGNDMAELNVRAGLQASVECAVASGEETTDLFGSDLYGDPIEIPAGGAYLSFGITANVGAGLEAAPNAVTFGVEADREITLTHYQRFSAGAVTFGQALEQTLRSFVIPGDIEDLKAMPEGSIATVEGNGSLMFSGTANLLSVANPLYSASIPANLGTISVSAGASIDIGASFQLTGKYQIRVQKAGAATYRIGFYRNRGQEFSISVSAKAALTMKVANSELIAGLMKVVSPNPELDQNELDAVGLNEEQVGAIEGAIKAGLERSLAVAVGIELGQASSHDAAFLYQVDIDKLDARGKEAIHRALRGKLDILTENEAALPHGITALKSIFTSIRERKHTLKVNLLGIYNFISITNLVRKSVVLHDPLTGELTISDSVTAERIRASMVNFETKTEKLRAVLAEQFLITTLYRSTRLVTSPPALRSTHSYFERHARTNRQTMKDNLDAAEAMKLLSSDTKATTLGQFDDFGASVLLLDTAYDDNIARSLFLRNGKPRPEEDYDRAGRLALERLVQAGEADDYRRKPALDDALWAQMKNVGQPGFGRLFPGHSTVQLETIRSDYTVIRWWSQTMHQMAVELEKVDRFLAASPKPNLESKEFNSLRAGLAKALESVARNVREQFGDPWGLVAMDIASGHQAEARFRLSCPLVSFNVARSGVPQAEAAPSAL